MLRKIFIPCLLLADACHAAEWEWQPVAGDAPLSAGAVVVQDRVAQMWLRARQPSEIELRIDFPPGEAAATGFARFLHAGTRSVRSRYKILRTTLTRTVRVQDGVVFIHLIADKPGALTFRVTLDKARIEDRRQLISPAAHVWVLPFESDVAGDGSSISVSGEGEALVLWVFGTGERATTLARLGARHDPGHNPPDPAKIWAGVCASAENSP